MASGFDPYHKWLSIPPKEQPPNHYRLLGLGLFEDDPDVISAAADRQMAHVQTYKNGPHSGESQKLLNEIAAAKLCLLKAPKRATYDAELRQRLAERPVQTPSLAPSFASASAQAAPVNAAARSTASAAAVAGRPITSPLPPPPIAVPPPIDDLDNSGEPLSAVGPKTVLAAGSALILLLIVAIVIVLKSGSNSGSSSPDTRPRPGDGNMADGTSQSSTTDGPVTSTVPIPVDPAVSSTTPPAASPSKAEENSSIGTSITTTTEPASANRVATAADPTKRPDSPPILPAPAPASDPTTVAKQPTTASMTTPTADNSTPKKLLVPDAMAIAVAEPRFSEMFAGTQPEAILEQSKPLTDGPLAYVALTKALDTATSSGNVVLVGRIVDELSRRFTIEAVPLRAKLYADLRKHVTAISDWHALGEAALASIDEAAAANRADLALPMAETSLLAARKSGDLELIRKVTLRVIELQDDGTGSPKAKAVKRPSSASKEQESAGT